NTTTFAYDQFNQVVRKQEPDIDGAAGGVWSYTYTRTGEQRSVTSPVGARVQATYDDLGRRITTTQLERRPQPTAFTTKFAYDDADNLTSTTSPDDDVSKQVYDTANQLITSIDPAGVTTQYGYDQVGRKITEKDGLGRYTAAKFDDAGRQTGVYDFSPSNALLRRTSVDYDPAGNPIARTDALGRTTTATFDALNRQVGQVEPVSASETITTGFGYDAEGHRTRYTDGRGNPTTYTFNNLGLPESVVEPSTQAHPAATDRTWTVAYDAATNPVSATAPGGVTRQRTFDPLNRLTKETGAGAEAATADRVNSYDLAGRLTGVSAPGGTNTFTYNDRGALLTATGPSGDSNFAYDATGRVTRRTDAAGTSTYGYSKGRLASIQDGVTGGRQTLSYNASGEVNQVIYGSGHVRTLDFDDLGRPTVDKLKNTAGAVVSSIAYGYDVNDNVTSKTTTGTAGAGQNTYTYDHAGRMTSWTGAGQTTTYGWDASGNRTRVNGKTSTFDARNRLLADGDFTYAYTARGTLASRTSAGLTDRMTYDAFDRMTGQGQATYAYDGLDRMVVRNGKSSAYSGTGDTLASDGAADYTRGPSGELVALKQGQDKRLAITDMHGDLIGGLAPGDGTAGLADSASFDPFGKVLGTGGSKRSIGFQGSWTDPDTAQVNMGSRWYNPSTGAFNSRDSVMAGSGASVLFNRYTYGSGSPVRYSDPDGHWGFDWVGDAIGAVGGWVNDNVVQPTTRAASAVVGWASKAINNVIDWGKRTWNNVVQWATNTWNSVVDWGKKTWNSFVDWGKRTWNTVSEKFSEVISWGSNALNNILGALESAWTAVDGALDAFSALGEKWVLNPIEDAAKTVFSAIPTIPARVVSMVTDLSVEDAQATIDAAWNAVVEAHPIVGQVGSFLSGAVEAAGGLVEFAWNFTPLRVIFSPSSLFSNILDLYGGLWNGLQDPVAFGKAMVDWDTWSTDPARALGHLVPDAIAAIFTGGGAAVGRRVGVGAVEAAAEMGVRRSAGQVMKDGARRLLSCKDGNSFLPATLVLMADGTRRAIEDVQVGDLVVATDPTTGVTEDKKVTDVIVGEGEKHLVEASVATEAGINAVTATDNHPFWVDGDGKWVDAGELRIGQLLHTEDGTAAAVIGLRAYTQVQRVYNLTVDGVHTFYVNVGDTPVLVHNEGESSSDLVYLWRGVTEGELGDILANRTWNSPQGVKYFSFTEKGAAEYSRRAFAAYPAEGPYTMIRTTARLSSLPADARMAYTADVIDGGVALDNDGLKILGRPSVMTGMSTGVGC
ncbi:MAG TPA: polymorphic toxin-type HINT domain-containing protein, partial [Umezawaea sp.]|nr:polymorphic toxin-type HINT domain-containing protein [Umezawaea sp.]